MKGSERATKDALDQAKAQQEAIRTSILLREESAKTVLAEAEKEIAATQGRIGLEERYAEAVRKRGEAQVAIADIAIAKQQQENAAAQKDAVITQQFIDKLIQQRRELESTRAALPAPVELPAKPTDLQKQAAGAREAERAAIEGDIAAVNNQIDAAKVKLAEYQQKAETGAKKLGQLEADLGKTRIESIKAAQEADLASVEERIKAEKQLQDVRNAFIETEKAEAEKRIGGLGNQIDVTRAQIDLLKDQGASAAVIAAKETEILGLLKQQTQERIKIAEQAVALARADAQTAQNQFVAIGQAIQQRLMGRARTFTAG